MLAPASSFEVNYVSHSGDLGNGVKATVLSQTENKHGGSMRAQLGKGEGVVEVQTFSGDLTLAPAK